MTSKLPALLKEITYISELKKILIQNKFKAEKIFIDVLK